MRRLAVLLAAFMLVLTCAVKAGDASSAEVERLRREVAELRRSVGTSSTRSSVDRAMERYGPDAPVTTRLGKLTISGLVQVWYSSYRNDTRGIFDDPNINDIPDTNETQDNDGFRIRRTELRFTMDIHENITAVVMIDPAREAISFPGTTDRHLFKRLNNVAPEFDDFNGPDLGDRSNVAAVQTGAGAVPRLLQDAYINYHGVIPHHDFTIGQFKPALGEEGIRSSAELDFAERSMIAQVNDFRDLGISVHGSWWDSRFQYWVGAFNGAGNYYLSAGQFQNRSDDNDNKDFNYRVLVRPLWQDECWGSLELGMSSIMGRKGEAGGRDPINNPINGLNRRKVWAVKHNPFISYQAGGPARGLWLRGEYLWIQDRNAPLAVVDLQGAGGSLSGFQQSDPGPFNSEGWYVSAGYNIARSAFCDSAPAWLRNFEFAARYEKFENIQVADLTTPRRTDNFKTRVITGGVNYYIKGNNAKIQINYNAVRNESGLNSGGNRRLHEVDDNNIVVNFQVAF